MVRNLKGGTGTKALARKHQNSSNNGNIRLPSCPAEQFAFVSKMFGHGMFEAFTNDGTRLTAHIPNKFRGRQKRQNTVVVSSIVLVGLREWETTPNKCDLLCIYDDNDFHTISSLPNAPRNLFNRIFNNNHYHYDNDNHNDLLYNSIFTNDNDNHNHNHYDNHLQLSTHYDLFNNICDISINDI